MTRRVMRGGSCSMTATFQVLRDGRSARVALSPWPGSRPGSDSIAVDTIARDDVV